jgi:uncharacterized protein
MATLGLLLGALIGLSLGLLGGGGSILTVPVFVYLLGFGAKEAIAMSLAVVGATAAFGAVAHWRSGNVVLRTAFLFGTVAMAGTYLGARLAVYFTESAQLLLFAVVMLLAAVLMLRDRGPEPTGDARGPAAPLTGLQYGLIVLEGLGVGVLTGLVGVGGGFLIVPALVLLGGLPMRQAVGTSLVVIAMKSTAGFYGYLDQVEIPWTFVGMFTGVAIVGALAGSYMAERVPQRVLKQSFAGLLLLVGGFLLYENLPARSPAAAPPAAASDAPVSLAAKETPDAVVLRLPNGHSPVPGVLTSAQPSPADLSLLAAAGVRTVIDLRDGSEDRGFDEAAVVAAAGMEYLSIPVSGMLDDAAIGRLRRTLAAAGTDPVLVHCASGNRVAAALMPYLALDLGMTELEVALAAERIGLRSDDLRSQAEHYITQYR